MNPINTILLQPTDVLFFRDGRPMEGSLAGHGAAWPLPNVTDAAFHAALHRSGLDGHLHDQRRGSDRDGRDNRRFGSLVTAGPFPVHLDGDGATWYFPRPLDLMDDSLRPVLFPTAQSDSVRSSLPDSLEYAVANTQPPSKDTKAKAWLSAAAFQRYLDGGDSALKSKEACDDSDFSDAEATVGIAIDPATGTTGQGEATGKIYSARYLRLRDEWRLGVFAKTDEKNGASGPVDLIRALLRQPHQLLVGGQQRLCTATRCEVDSLPLPVGKTDGFIQHDGKWLVKWILLTPAIWPEIPDKKPDGTPITDRNGRPIEFHSGGWLPNWVRQENGQVMLRTGKRQSRSYNGKHVRGFGDGSEPIAAKLVAAIVPKPVPVSGWALPNDLDRAKGGAKSTHLAVPAGAVYYFEADSSEAAQKLANALNWHGSEKSEARNPQSEITMNRRSTLMGEKGFGLGVCGTWAFFPSASNAHR
jgi:CRISPR-associated protein Cmr3